MKDKIDDYLFEDNVRRLFLRDLLIRKSCLKNLTLEELDWLIQDINSLVSNLNHNFKRGKKVIKVSDENYNSGNSLFRDIFLHNVLDIEINYMGTEKDFKNKLISRWAKDILPKKEVIDKLR